MSPPHFTKGTWVYSHEFDAVVVVSHHRVVPVADFGKISLLENEANGYLFGAAKEMYDALRMVANKHPDALIHVNKAIFKVEHRPKRK